MNTDADRPQVWKRLFDAALVFKALAPWQWMYDADAFGVKNPETGEIGTCAVLGRAGEVFGISVYLGSEGLTVFEATLNGEIVPGEEDVLFRMKALTLYYDDRSELDPRDLKRIKDLGYKFRGRNAWPKFRNYLPGFFPWYFSAADARFMTLALEQAVEVAGRFKENPTLLEPSTRDQYLVRVAEKTGVGLTWRDEWDRPEPSERAEPAPEPLDDARVEALKRDAPRRKGMIWEFDVRLVPTPILEGERPYYPRVILCLDQKSQMVLGTKMIGPPADAAAIGDGLMEVMERLGAAPIRMWVKRWEVLVAVAPLAERLGIEIALEKKLPTLDRAFAELLSYLGR